ncbi:hypothetical protein NIES4071_76080 [Calothrix sp. NIES-4071]|nr:hypothetical protein NIES4071_76080 [Calothrix sp. NIES-4071]BAZ61883.1 hypothetical protein NIES4105_76030 [Calothrix sp. NIES-4105]
MLAVIGSEKQEEASTVISFYDTDFTPTIEWPSLANMLFAWVEIREGRLDDLVSYAIHQKYGRKAGELYW